MKFLSSDKAASEVIGHVIILGLTITGVAMITLIGVPSIYRLQDMANVRNAEQTFTVLDSRASSVLLGDSPMQIVDVNLGGGTLTVEPDGTGMESYMVIKSTNNTFNITIPMGKVKYSLDERIVAYEGGGIWSKYPSGGSVMLSPPEFHYNGKTLTLPVLNIIGDTSVGGKGTAAVYLKKNATMVLYPTQDPNRTNPLNYSINGKIYVNITSDFYDAWADYSKRLLYTKVSTNSTSSTTSIELTVVPSTLGESIEIINPINFRGLPDDNTPLDNFSFKIKPQGNNLDWDIRAKSGNKTLIFFLKDKQNWAVGKKVTLQIGYQDGTGSGTAETWEGDGLYTIQPDNYIYVDLLNTSNTLMYTSGIQVGSNNGASCQPFGTKIGGGSSFSNPDFSWDNITINAGDTQSLYNITQHYIWKMAQIGDISFGNCPPSGNKVPDNSTMLINYNATGAITFLHVSDNTADVSIS